MCRGAEDEGIVTFTPGVDLSLRSQKSKARRSPYCDKRHLIISASDRKFMRATDTIGHILLYAGDDPTYLESNDAFVPERQLLSVRLHSGL